MPRQDRRIAPLVNIPPEVTGEVLIRLLNEKIEEINNSFASLDVLESELRGEEGYTVNISSDIMLSGGRVRDALPSQKDNDYVTRGELKKFSVYADRSGRLKTERVLETKGGVVTPRAAAPEVAPNLGQLEDMMSGTVRGPASSTDNSIARWDGTSGRLLKDGTIGAAIPDLTDNSGGTANDTIQALPDPADAPASADALRDDLVANLIPALRNDIADLAAKVNTILASLRAGFFIDT